MKNKEYIRNYAFDCRCKCGAIFGASNPYAYECPTCRKARLAPIATIKK